MGGTSPDGAIQPNMGRLSGRSQPHFPMGHGRCNLSLYARSRTARFTWRTRKPLMIPRYTRQKGPQLGACRQTRFRIWVEREEHRPMPWPSSGSFRGGGEDIWPRQDCQLRCARLDEIEREVKHDVIAFLTHLRDRRPKRLLHDGLTGSDVIATASTAAQACRPILYIPISDRPARRAQAPRARAQAHTHHRRFARNPCRAHHVRPSCFDYAELARAKGAFPRARR